MRRLAERVESLPVLPRITAQLLEALDEPDTSAADLANLISSDQALATRLLKLANSAYYGFPRRIGTVNLAVVVLGFETVRDMCLSVLITDSFFHDIGKLPQDMEAAWEHSLSAAVACRLLLRSTAAANPGEGFVAGLVHDIGKLFLARYFPEEYLRLLRKATESGLPLLEAETEVFRVTHPLAGAWLLDAWNLPLWLVYSTRDHHGVQNGSEPDGLTQAVSFADLLVRRAGFEAGPGVATEVTPEMIRVLRLKTDVIGSPDYNYYFEKLQQELQRADELLKIMRQPPQRDEQASIRAPK